MKYFFVIFLFFHLGCSSASVDTDYRRGTHSVRCLNLVARCHDKARSVCTDGYLVTNRVRPRRQGDDTQYILNIKCRNPVRY